MTKKELEAKVINAQSAVAKREAVLAKHREQLAKLIAKGADQYDIRYKEDDIKTATGKLEDARRILKNWQDKLGAQISRDAFIEANAPQVIKDFLERWKPEPFKCCETCANMQPIGEGDHICDACCSHDGSPTALVLESYIPADDYFICGGSRWTPQ